MRVGSPFSARSFVRTEDFAAVTATRTSLAACLKSIEHTVSAFIVPEVFTWSQSAPLFTVCPEMAFVTLNVP
jgi:hypothetical protein